jgi:predicted ATPase/class 3 adenylate cyclase
MGEIFSFGVWVRRRRKALDLTQDALARRAGCALSMIRKIEADERKPSRQIATLLASALEIPAAEREQFLQAARAELAVDKLAAPQLPSAPEPPLVTLPTGTVTFLFTDIAGSTRLWEQHPTAMQPALARHDAILRDAIAAHGGTLVKGTGDGLHAAFVRATDGVHAALAAQRALTVEDWGAIGLPRGQSLRVRMALHIGVAEERNGDYFGPAINRTARLLAIGHGGQILLSHAMCDVVRDHLPPGAALRDLGTHQLKDLSREEQIWQLSVPDLPADFPPLASLSTRRHNLPIQLTSFVGRENELAEIGHLLESTRLLTLTGPGGTGKTRLSLQVAAELLAASHEPSTGNADRFPDGVWLVELAPLADPALVPQAVATVLDLREDAGRPLLATLTDFLRGKDLLLIIDNCEHVVDACAQLAETLLRACPQVRILASSREALGIAGEVAWRVPSLATPDPHRLPGIETLTQYEAVQLFVERAQSVLPGFTLTNANAPALAQVCARLDGIPLAIELAAARLRVLTVEQIAARLDDRFRLLTGGSRTALPRHQTLQALIDWSYDLLSEAEQVLLRRLAVFAGGWTLEAAEAIASELRIENEELKEDRDSAMFSILNSQFSILDGLAHLVDKSLVMVDEQGNIARYTMLETIQQYATERLARSGEADAVRQRHAQHYLALAEEAQRWSGRAEEGVWFDRLEIEHDNLRAALRWALGGGDAELGSRLVIMLAGLDLGSFWGAHGYWSEARRWLEAVLEQRSAIAPTIRAQAIIQTGFYAWILGGSVELYRIAVEKALAIYQEVGDKAGIAFVLWTQGNDPGDYAHATQLLEKALALYRELGDHHGIACVLHTLGDVARNQGDAARSMALLKQSLSICREWGFVDEMAGVLNGLGDMAVNQGDLARAMALYWEAVTLVEGKPGNIIWALRNLGWMALVQGDDGRVLALLQQHVEWFREKAALGGLIVLTHLLGAVINIKGDSAQATAILHEGLILQHQLEQQEMIAESLEAFAGVAIGQGQPMRAARLLGAAEMLRSVIGVPLPTGARPAYERDVAAARAQLDEAAFAATWAAGRQLTLEQAVAEALAETPSNERTLS